MASDPGNVAWKRWVQQMAESEAIPKPTAWLFLSFFAGASQYRALPELFTGKGGCLRGLQKIGAAPAESWPRSIAHLVGVRAADSKSLPAPCAQEQQEPLQQEPPLPSDGRASAVPQLSCPGLISRSQSAVSSDAGRVSISDVERPTLLRSAKALQLNRPSRSSTDV